MYPGHTLLARAPCDSPPPLPPFLAPARGDVPPPPPCPCRLHVLEVKELDLAALAVAGESQLVSVAFSPSRLATRASAESKSPGSGPAAALLGSARRLQRLPDAARFSGALKVYAPWVAAVHVGGRQVASALVFAAASGVHAGRTCALTSWHAVSGVACADVSVHLVRHIDSTPPVALRAVATAEWALAPGELGAAFGDNDCCCLVLRETARGISVPSLPPVWAGAASAAAGESLLLLAWAADRGADPVACVHPARTPPYWPAVGGAGRPLGPESPSGWVGGPYLAVDGEGGAVRLAGVHRRGGGEDGMVPASTLEWLGSQVGRDPSPAWAAVVPANRTAAAGAAAAEPRRPGHLGGGDLQHRLLVYEPGSPGAEDPFGPA